MIGALHPYRRRRNAKASCHRHPSNVIRVSSGDMEVSDDPRTKIAFSIGSMMAARTLKPQNVSALNRSLRRT
jgi:hypothetical protein